MNFIFQPLRFIYSFVLIIYSFHFIFAEKSQQNTQNQKNQTDWLINYFDTTVISS